MWLSSWYRAAQVESFYREHPLLSEMRARQTEANHSASAREALLQRLGLGIQKDAAVAMLHKEGFDCQTISEPLAESRLRQIFIEDRGLRDTPSSSAIRKDFIDCQMTSPNLIGYKHWIVDLEFDADWHLSDARIAVWNIGL